MLPQNLTVASLSPDTVGVVLRGEGLTEVVTLDIARDSSEVLSAVCRGPR